MPDEEITPIARVIHWGDGLVYYDYVEAELAPPIDLGPE